jgi:protein-tyrosine phosphatase
MNAKPYWITNHIAIILCPRGDHFLDDEMKDLRSTGIDVVVSMLRSQEARSLGLAEEEAAAQRAGLLFVNFPIQDGSVPNNKESFLEFLATLEGHLANGRRIAIHCRGSIGRAPLTTASLLVRSGTAPEAAWSHISILRECPVPDTKEQRKWVENHIKPKR